ncbi:MAG: hypothetical protein LBL47_01980 [Lactobacillus sp.]|jgi:hypothetical protein|nr:hypothetical protein [Lactobacillus sp.]
MKKCLFLLGFCLFSAPAAAQMPYMEEVRALGSVAGQGMACGASKYDTFEMLARAILITKAPSDKIQSDGMYAYNEEKANAYFSKRLDGFYECAAINRRFDAQDIFKVRLYGDGTIQMPDGKIFTPRVAYDATLVYNKKNKVREDAQAIYDGGARDNVDIKIKSEGIESVQTKETVATVREPDPYMPARVEAIHPNQVQQGAREVPAEMAGSATIKHIKSKYK